MLRGKRDLSRMSRVFCPYMEAVPISMQQAVFEWDGIGAWRPHRVLPGAIGMADTCNHNPSLANESGLLSCL